ncbi:MAG: hypothetical protein P1V97_03175 [Planctomycetota bacterium]|nr:hypothetical protein [Planctomycetota bacterium]
MGERGSRKIPVTEREFLWVQDDDKGEVVLHVGPTMVSPTAADRIVIDDNKGRFREDVSGRPQRMVEVDDNQYAVLENPLLEPDQGPNGRFKPGRNESRPLKNGTRKMIPGPCSFWLRPGQRCEVRDAHELGSSQYLVVKVYGEVDNEAPYYNITAKSAAIRETTDDTDAEQLSDVDSGIELTRGQLIVIRGLDTQFYIPPTGLDIVPDTSIDSDGTRLDARAAAAMLAQVETIAPTPEPIPDFASSNMYAAEEALDEDEDDDEYYREVQKRAPRSRNRKKKPNAAMPPPPQQQRRMPPPPVPQAASSNLLADAGPSSSMILGNIAQIPALRQAVEKEARKARLVRDAVVLGEKEYCVIINADGKRQIKVGPARVFPGPYDQFQYLGSDNRVYEAYELLPQRALWVRFIAPMPKSQLAKHLPRNIKLEEDQYEPGDELLITGVNTFFFPFNEIEILSPSNGQPIFGNDHSKVFIEAIGIDQKSGIYCSDLATGEVKLVRGKCSYLVDPRKEVHIARRVPPEDWNNWIAFGEKHKLAREPINTWWALSIIVPPNTACLATSANSQRVIEGPCVTLLEYEERLVPLQLSTGVPKNEDNALETCFLRVVGNRVSDSITVETADFVEVKVRVSYGVTFQREKKNLWFGTENYVQVMCEHLRSLVRNICRTRSLIDLWPKLPTLIRDTILGKKDGDNARPGRAFEEYGFVVTEVEVLSSQIQDPNIGDLMRQMQNESVALQIGDRQANEKYESANKRSDLDVKHHELKLGAEKRNAEFQGLVAQLEQDLRLGTLRRQEELEHEKVTLTAKRTLDATKSQNEQDQLSLGATVERLEKETAARVEANRLKHLEEIEYQSALSQIEMALTKASADATVAEREAVQAGLVEAMTGLGDKIMLGEAAKNMNLVSLFQGKDVGTILTEILGGTKVTKTLSDLREKHKKSK